MIYYRISELMLATFILRYDKIISFQERKILKFYRLSGATFYECINTIYEFIKSFLDNKIAIFEEFGAFKVPSSFPTDRLLRQGMSCLAREDHSKIRPLRY